MICHGPNSTPLIVPATNLLTATIYMISRKYQSPRARQTRHSNPSTAASREALLDGLAENWSASGGLFHHSFTAPSVDPIHFRGHEMLLCGRSATAITPIRRPRAKFLDFFENPSFYSIAGTIATEKVILPTQGRLRRRKYQTIDHRYPRATLHHDGTIIVKLWDSRDDLTASPCHARSAKHQFLNVYEVRFQLA